MTDAKTAMQSSTYTDLNKSFGDKHVVVDLSMRVERGEIFGFLGPNGSGKTTSIRLMCGLLTPDSGSGTCLGYDIRTQSEAIKRNVGYMTQRFSFWDDLTIRENLDFIARVYEMRDRARRRSTARSTSSASPAAPDSSPARSPGGWKQRLALAACMLHRPRLLLLDEPTAGVDPECAARILGGAASARRAGHLGARQHALHGRGRALPQARVHRVRPTRSRRERVAEVIAAQHLTTYAVSGPDLAALSEKLRASPASSRRRRSATRST